MHSHPLTAYSLEQKYHSIDQRTVFANGQPLIKHDTYSQHFHLFALLIDYKPIKELSGEFFINESKITFKDVSYGKLTCNGTIDITHPYHMNLTLGLDSLDMASFLSVWMDKEKNDAAGFVFGEIKISGPLHEIFLKGKLTSYNGYVNKLEFSKFFLDIEGIYPEMQIQESSVSQTEGMSFLFEGPINLSRESKDDFYKQVKALNISPIVRDSESEVEWTLKSSTQKDRGTTELKYLKRKSSDGSSRDKDGSDMFGIENIFEF